MPYSNSITSSGAPDAASRAAYSTWPGFPSSNLRTNRPRVSYATAHVGFDPGHAGPPWVPATTRPHCSRQRGLALVSESEPAESRVPDRLRDPPHATASASTCSRIDESCRVPADVYGINTRGGILMWSFLTSVVSSLVGTLLFVTLSGLLASKARWVLTVTFGRLLGIDVEYVFRDKETAKPDVMRAISRAQRVDMFTFRGTDLQRDTFTAILNGSSARLRLMLPYVDRTPPLVDWIAQREAEIASFDSSPGQGVLAEQIRVTERFLRDHIAAGRVELRRFTIPPFGRILITDRVAYFTAYRKDMHGRQCPVVKYRRGGEMYDWCRRLFDQLWEHEPQSVRIRTAT